MNHTSKHKLPAEFQLSDVIETEIGTVYIYDNILIFEANEGIVLSYKTGFSILLKSLRILKTKPWIYISNRVNSYSFNTMDLKYLNHVPTLKAIAVVNHSEYSKMNAELEDKFISKPFKTFYNVYDAADWGKAYL
ncbi:hypothetical protein [Aequorivita marina]|uniref:hypothetical protein n=1 Tax=Aequorivita marina TaxID=3073654 RepID=UPI002874FD03|nr:hypothetical protein [Aequorivita sp. S2608]MDS1297575.1 hypothetical protein [Aequorivita sp. S2608]